MEQPAKAAPATAVRISVVEDQEDSCQGQLSQHHCHNHSMTKCLSFPHFLQQQQQQPSQGQQDRQHLELPRLEPLAAGARSLCGGSAGSVNSLAGCSSAAGSLDVQAPSAHGGDGGAGAGGGDSEDGSCGGGSGGAAASSGLCRRSESCPCVRLGADGNSDGKEPDPPAQPSLPPPSQPCPQQLLDGDSAEAEATAEPENQQLGDSRYAGSLSRRSRHSRRKCEDWIRRLETAGCTEQREIETG